jgi:Putative adhesin
MIPVRSDNVPTFDTPEPISVILDITVGDIQVEASERGDTVVEIRPTDPAKDADLRAAEQTRVEYASGRLTIRMPRGWRQYAPRGGRESVDVRIGLPVGSQLHAESGLATLRSTGRLGECRCKTGAGDIHVEEATQARLRTGAGSIFASRIAGPAEISTGSGTLSLGAIDGTATVKNSNGDTRIGSVGGDLKVNSANGSISVDQARSDVAAKTAMGSISLGEVSRGDIVAETAFGKVSVGVADGVAAWLDLSTRFGHVSNDLDTGARPAPGEGAVQVHVRTSYGDIAVSRSAAA